MQQYGPLDGEGHDEDADCHAARSVAAEEGHQQPKAKESLEVDIPETWRRRCRRMRLEQRVQADTLLPAAPPEGAWTPPALTGLRELKAQARINQPCSTYVCLQPGCIWPWMSLDISSGDPETLLFVLATAKAIPTQCDPTTLCSGSCPLCS